MIYKSILLGLLIILPQISQAQDRISHRDVRFYKVNKFLQADRIRFTKKRAAQAGCHNFLKKSRVHRAVYFGFGACSLFSQKDCPLDSVIAVAREKDEVSTTVMAEGYSWFPQSEHPQGSKLKSWYCSASADDHPVEVVETEIEKEEIIEDDQSVQKGKTVKTDQVKEEDQVIEESQSLNKDQTKELD